MRNRSDPEYPHRRKSTASVYRGGLLRLLIVLPLGLCMSAAFLVCLPFVAIDYLRRYL